jgi:hypothetical protein
MNLRKYILVALSLLSTSTGFAAAHLLPSVPSEIYNETKQAETPTLKLGAEAKTLQVRLAPVPDDDIKSLREHNRRSGKAMQIGIGRDIPQTQPSGPLSSAFDWIPTADGGLAARFAVTSPGAKGLRMGITVTRLDDEVEMRFFGSDKPQRIHGPVDAAIVRAQQPIYWSPVTDGETSTLEVYLPPGISPQSAAFDIPRLSHLARNARGEWQKSIGDSGSCEVDIACVSNPSQALINAKNAVARMVFTVGGSSYTCTGTLLNDSDTTTFIPYFYSANHCISDQVTASTLNTYWFFEAPSCGSGSAPNTIQKAGGAVLLHTSNVTDATLLRLNDTPPGGTVFSGWDANTISVGTEAIGIHHPEGDLKKFSRGVIQGYQNYNSSGSFIAMLWNLGVTEGGSSGSGLFTIGNGLYQLRGGLKGGSASCDNTLGIDKYSRLDLVYPDIQQYLYPTSSGPAADKTAIEFYNTSLKHFFITIDPDEAAGIDAGAAGPGWVRTGGTFKVWGTQVSGSMPVCRFYGSVWPGPNSHFFTSDSGECAYLQFLQASTPAFQPRWNYEGTAYYAFQPQNSYCANGKTPIYRYYNNGYSRGVDSNHRLTTDSTVRSAMETAGWTYEGVTMCGLN